MEVQQREILENFKEISGVRSDQQATEILRRYNWNLDVNININIISLVSLVELTRQQNFSDCFAKCRRSQ